MRDLIDHDLSSSLRKMTYTRDVQMSLCNGQGREMIAICGVLRSAIYGVRTTLQ